MLTLIDYLKAFAKHINELTWMSSETKVKALDKLNKFTVKVGYPDKWKDYTSLSKHQLKMVVLCMLTFRKYRNGAIREN